VCEVCEEDGETEQAVTHCTDCSKLYCTEHHMVIYIYIFENEYAAEIISVGNEIFQNTIEDGKK